MIVINRSTAFLQKLYSVNPIAYSNDMFKDKRVQTIKYSSYIVVIVDIIHRLINLGLWLDKQSQYKLWSIIINYITYVLYFGLCIILIYNFGKITTLSKAAFNSGLNNIPAYKVIYYNRILHRLRNVQKIFLIWFILYFIWSCIDITHWYIYTQHHISPSKVSETEYNNMEKVYKIALFWLFWVFCDTTLFVGLLTYIEPIRPVSDNYNSISDMNDVAITQQNWSNWEQQQLY